MEFYRLILRNLINGPLLCFGVGTLIAFLRPDIKLPDRLSRYLTIIILFCMGLKGGGSFAEYNISSSFLFWVLLSIFVAWGLLQPLFSFYLLKYWIRIDGMTAAAISASFGSVSVMTFVSAIAFLDQLHVSYDPFTIVALAIMEVPAIISGIFLASTFGQSRDNSSFIQIFKVLYESLINPAVIALSAGLIMGGVCYHQGLLQVNDSMRFLLSPLLGLFLLDMGLKVGSYRGRFQSFSWPLVLFGIYTPLLGSVFGLLVAYLFNLNVGTGTLMAILAASASYIAVPAAMRIAVPQAKEAIYLPLSLGIAFPFNVVVGIPLYYQLAAQWLSAGG